MPELRDIRRVVSLLTAVVLIVPGAVLPVLDAHEETDRPVIEAEHDPARCSVSHDHLACIQHASSASHPMPAGMDVPAAPVQHRRSTAAAAEVPRSPTTLSSLPRAPPSFS